MRPLCHVTMAGVKGLAWSFDSKLRSRVEGLGFHSDHGFLYIFEFVGGALHNNAALVFLKSSGKSILEAIRKA